MITLLRVRTKITSQNWLIRESKTTGIASYFEDFAKDLQGKADSLIGEKTF